MQTVVESLRDDHRYFSEHLDAIQRTAERVGELSLPELRSQIDEVYAFLAERFIPHSRAEEGADPLVAVEVGRLCKKLLALRERLVFSHFGTAELRSLRRLMYDLHAIIRLHVAKEASAAEALGAARVENRPTTLLVEARDAVPAPSARPRAHG